MPALYNVGGRAWSRRTECRFGVWQRGQRSWMGSKLNRQLAHSLAMELLQCWQYIADAAVRWPQVWQT